MLLGLVGCSSGQSEESQPGSISSEASQAETESSGEAVTILESASESEESEPETGREQFYSGRYIHRGGDSRSGAIGGTGVF